MTWAPEILRQNCRRLGTSSHAGFASYECEMALPMACVPKQALEPLEQHRSRRSTIDLHPP